MIALDVLYRDDRLIAVNKPSGLSVHRGWSNDERFAMTIVRDQISQHVHPVHRLDRATSGVLLFALDPECARRIQEMFGSGEIEKRYRALIRGVPPPEVEIDHPIPRSEGGPRVPARTRITRLFSKDRYAWVEAQPMTGRLHQVRRHLKHISHPIIGDVRYGKGEHNRFFRAEHGLHRLALHALEIALPHPGTGDRLAIRAPLPSDLAEPLERWGLPIVYM
jgi:tRNA pseudouridine65 synthase